MEHIGILGMSLEASLLILAIVVIRSLALHRLPKATFIALWGVAVARLLIPFKIPSGLSVYSLLGRLTGSASPGVIIETAKNVTVTGGAAASQTLSGFTLSPTAVLWGAGFALCAAFFTVSYFICVRRFSASLPVENSFVSGWLGTHKIRRAVEVRQSDTVSSPLTYGVLKPVILLPSATDFADSAQLTYILAHEHAHIRRFDAAVKLLLALVVSIHWFNPAVWVMYILANRDLELCCDEYAVRSLGENAKSLYALALIGMAEQKSGLTPLCSGFCKTAAEERIVSIMKIRKSSAWSAALAVTLIASTCAVFATSAKSPDKVALTPLTEAQNVSRVEVRTNEKTGKSEMSIDGGKTWDPLNMSDPDLFPKSSTVVWWTADEYAKWLEQEKKDLQALVGTDNGVIVDGKLEKWTQKKVDETIAMYEETLKEMKNGIKFSKTVDGRDDIMISTREANIDDVSVTAAGDSEIVITKDIPATEITASATASEANDSIPATKITASATASEANGSIHVTEITASATASEANDSIPATKITENAKKSK